MMLSRCLLICLSLLMFAMEAPADAYLAGQMLVAATQMKDPRFERSVIYVVAHNADGAMGLIVNRAAGQTPLRHLLGELGFRTRSTRPISLHFGGPVEMRRGFLLHSTDRRAASTQLLPDGLALSTGIDMLRQIAEGKAPKQFRFLLGYAGWGAGQLERELARVDWLIAPADPAVIFAKDASSIWKKALTRAGIRL